MSLVRKYGNFIINLTKIISVEQSGESLKFGLPISNWYNGNSYWSSDQQKYKIELDTTQEAKKELECIQKTLNDYYNKK